LPLLLLQLDLELLRRPCGLEKAVRWGIGGRRRAGVGDDEGCATLRLLLLRLLFDVCKELALD
jgi:hypothetical protein